MTGRTSRLPQLIECASIPKDKREIVTPDMARKFTHLQEIADEISPYDPQANVDFLIGGDMPELLKIGASKNGPKGAPWTQKLDLRRTLSGQMCLDRVGGPIHINARRTTIEPEQTNPLCLGQTIYTSYFPGLPSCSPPKPFQNKGKLRAERRNRSRSLPDDRRRQYGGNVALIPTSSGDHGDWDPQKRVQKLGNATSLSILKYHNAL